MSNRITIYPNDDLILKLEKEASKQKRSLNNFILLALDSYFTKDHGKK